MLRIGGLPVVCRVAVAVALVVRTAFALQGVDFNRDVRPVLAAKCFACHGPDEESRQAELRLDLRDDAIRKRDGRRAVCPGDAAGSELVRRIQSEDADTRMPPPESNKTLSPKEIETLTRWIDEGAEYEPHWAFVRPRRSGIPDVRGGPWVRTAIDRFVLARLESNRLAPNPDADLHTLLRRVFLDLIGLPPRPVDVEAFQSEVQSRSLDEAYQRLVDRLLASPHYGERWARRWLDLARYADTNGYEKDRERTIWPYRDWVVQALNSDMPFDQFTVEQLAGDMLPDATVQQRIATGFHRNTMLNEEGGIDPLEFRFYAMTDRVATTGTTWLGLTLGCAQCHTHKYDPITQREYYQLMAFLNNCDEPDIGVIDSESRQQALQDAIRAKELLDELPSRWPVDGQDAGNTSPAAAREAAEGAFQAWLANQRAKAVSWTGLVPLRATSNLPILTIEDDHTIFVSGDITKRDTYEVVYQTTARGVTAFRLEALPDNRLPAHGPGMTYYEGSKGDFFLCELTIEVDGRPVTLSRASHSYAKNQFGPPVSAELAIDGDPQTGWSIAGREGERHAAVFCVDPPVDITGEVRLTMEFGRHFASSLGRFRLAMTTASQGAEAQDLTAEAERLLVTPAELLDDEQQRVLRHAFFLSAPELKEHADQIRRLLRPDRFPTTLGFRERPLHKLRPTHVHRRGEFLQPADEVQANVPVVLPPLPVDQPRDRLAFARWLVSPDNPLTPRVVVNRQWAALFGQGIVRTVEDFGTQGEPPTHPELLDWLAVELIESGWSLKRIHRQIVTSSAYRQSSSIRESSLVNDPSNLLLSHAPRPRLEAEILRDTLLRAGGLLSTKMGGPGVRPPQPAGVTETAYGSPQWQASEGADRYRRSMYTFRKRTAPFAMYDAFDAPSGEACLARRNVSNTPLQALTVLNDTMLIEAAQALGHILAACDGDDQDRIAYGYQRVVTRPPDDEELAVLMDFVADQRHRFQDGRLDPGPLAGDGTSDPGERATWTAVARALLSLDETMTRN
jgi:hypothetical protein